MPVIPVRAAGSANVGGSIYIARNRLNNAFARDLLRYWEVDGPKLINRVAEEQPGVLLKCLTMMVPREYKIEHQNPTGALSDEQLGLMVLELEERISARLQGEAAKVVNAVAIEAPAPAKPKVNRPKKVKLTPRKPQTPEV